MTGKGTEYSARLKIMLFASKDPRAAWIRLYSPWNHTSQCNSHEMKFLSQNSPIRIKWKTLHYVSCTSDYVSAGMYVQYVMYVW